MERKIIRGKSTKDQMASVEHALKSIKRRAGTRMVGLIPPTIIHYYCPTPTVDGLLMRAIVPMECQVTKILLYIERMEISNVVVYAELLTDVADSTVKVPIKSKMTEFTLDWQVEKGGILSCTTDTPDKIKEIAIAWVMYPTTKHYGQIDFTPQLKALLDKEEEI